MTEQTRFDRVLPGLFDELADARTPAYLEAALERASSRRQRPAWTYPGRWLPMQITTEAVPTARGPWRQLAILALIGILIVAAAVAYVGSRPSQPALPAPPFGPAANGVIAVEQDGDILVADQANGETRPLVVGPESDTVPVFSPDGTKLGFQRAVDGQTDGAVLMVADADGSNVVRLTAEPVQDLHSWSFAPDGQSLLAIGRLDGEMRVFIRPIDPAAGPTVLDVRLPDDPGKIEAVSFRPTDPQEILVMAQPDPTGPRGVYVHELATGELRTIVQPASPFDPFGASWSPTGDRISYGLFDESSDGISARAHVVAADGTGDRTLDDAPGTSFDLQVSPWSNDGTRMVLFRGPTATDGEKAIVVSAVGDGAPVELACGATADVPCANHWTWSPDDSMLIGTFETGGYLRADPASGQVTPIDWDGTSQPSWQRVGP